MASIKRYAEHAKEAEFSRLLSDALSILELQTGENTFEWEFEDGVEKGKEPKGLYERIKKFLTGLSKEQAVNYFNRLVEEMKFLPEKVKKRTLTKIAAIFLTLVGINELLPEKSILSNPILAEIKMELSGEEKPEPVKAESKKKKSSFDEAQRLVSIEEAGYSDDRDDTGNWLVFNLGKKKVKRFIGTKYGISAPVLKSHLGKIPKKEDMVNLKYRTAVEIYKKKYWAPQNLGQLENQSIANVLYDGCVNQGVEGMKAVLRKALADVGISVPESENPFDAKHVESINKLQEQARLFEAIKKHRKNRYMTAQTFDKHGEGWLNRLDRIEYENLT